MYLDEKKYKELVCLLQKVLKEQAVVNQNNIVQIVEIPVEELSGTGTQQEQVAEWITNNGPFTVPEDVNIFFVVILPDPVILKPFAVEEKAGDACNDFLTEDYNVIYYHNGQNTYPEWGDTIYYDEEGTNLASNIDYLNALPCIMHPGEPGWLKTNNEGIFEDIFECR